MPLSIVLATGYRAGVKQSYSAIRQENENTTSGIGAALTACVMFLVEADTFRDLSGMVTSFVMFLGIVATFTSGAWLMTIMIAVAWVLALRMQSLGEPESAR